MDLEVSMERINQMDTGGPEEVPWQEEQLPRAELLQEEVPPQERLFQAKLLQEEVPPPE